MDSTTVFKGNNSIVGSKLLVTIQFKFSNQDKSDNAVGYFGPLQLKARKKLLYIYFLSFVC